MNINEKTKLINKLIKDKSNLMFDYFHFFEQKEISEDSLYKKWEEFVDINKEWNIGVKFYLHIPFCSTICKYCMFNKKLITSKNEVDNYIDNVISFLERYKLLFKNTNFKWIYVWGWTPSLLSTDQLNKLFSYIFSNFNFNEEYYNSIELNPTSTTFDKLKKIKELWFNRISFWVQSFKKETLKIENRPYVSPERLKNIVEEAKSLGFEDINIDLLIWLNNENFDDIINNIEKVNYINPYTVFIYPLLKWRERSILHNWDENMFIDNVVKIHKKIINNKNLLENYKISSKWNLWEFLLENKYKIKNKKRYDAISHDKNSLFWVWYQAYWKIWWVWSYKSWKFNYDNSHYFEKSNFKTEMFSYLLNFFQDRIYKPDFSKKFNYNLLETFDKEINFLEKKWIIKQDKDNVYFVWKPNQLYYWLIFLDKYHLMLFIKNNFFNHNILNIHKRIK